MILRGSPLLTLCKTGRSPLHDASQTFPGRARRPQVTAFAIRRGVAGDVAQLAPLFDAYRVFYQQPSDVEAAATFIRERIERDESVVFVAEDPDGILLGFVQLFGTWASTTTPPGRLWLLEDLYVGEPARRRGVGRALMERAERLAQETGAVGLMLSTGIDNLRAHRLYESMAYRRLTRYFTYTRMLV